MSEREIGSDRIAQIETRPQRPTLASASAPRRLDVFPVFRKVAMRRVTIVGEGDEAAAKLRLLGETSADIIVVGPEPGEELVHAAAAAGATLVRDRFRPAHLTGAVLVFAASGDEAADRAVVRAARALGIPVNAVDRSDLCDFYVGALVNRAPVAVAVTSSGVGPVFARHLRARIEAMLPRETGSLARLAESVRDVVAHTLPDSAARRRFWARFFSGRIADAVAAGRLDAAHQETARLLDRQRGAGKNGFVWLVGAGPGAEDLLTLRAQRVLQEADVIVHDRLVPVEVVAMGRRDARRISVGKAKGAHSASQDEINALLIALAHAGERVVRLKAGDPIVFGRLGEEISALRAACVPYAVVPGVTAAFAAAASAEIPLTLRGVASSIVFVTGHDCNGDTLPDWTPMALTGVTVAVYMGRSVAKRIADILIDAGLDPETPAAIVENASRRDEAIYLGKVDDLTRILPDGEAMKPALIVIGRAVAAARDDNATPIAAAPLERLAA